MRRTTLIVAAGILFLVSGHVAGQAQTVQVTTAQSVVRLEPKATGTIVARPPVGATLEVIAEAGDWLQVKLPKDSSGFDRVGYIRKAVTKALTSITSAQPPKDDKPQFVPPPPPPPPQPKQITVPAGTEVKLRMAATLSSEDAKVGDVVDLRVTSDVLVSGETAIKQDAVAVAHLTAVTAQRLRRPGVLEFTIDSVPAMNGDIVKLTGSQSIKGKVGLVRADEAVIAEGTSYTATVSADTILSLKAVQPVVKNGPSGSSPSTVDNASASVQLVSKTTGGQGLRAVAGDMTEIGIPYVGKRKYMVYPSVRATARTKDRLPEFLVKSVESPVNRFFIVKTEVDKGKRSVKIGQGKTFEGIGSQSSLNTPDEDWTVPFDASEESSSVWRLKPRRQLQTGEYGMFVRSGDLYDFGVD